MQLKFQGFLDFGLLLGATKLDNQNSNFLLFMVTEIPDFFVYTVRHAAENFEQTSLAVLMRM